MTLSPEYRLLKRAAPYECKPISALGFQTRSLYLKLQLIIQTSFFLFINRHWNSGKICPPLLTNLQTPAAWKLARSNCHVPTHMERKCKTSCHRNVTFHLTKSGSNRNYVHHHAFKVHAYNGACVQCHMSVRHCVGVIDDSAKYRDEIRWDDVTFSGKRSYRVSWNSDNWV